MNKPTLVIMAAGMGSRFGGCKQITPVDSDGHLIIDYSIFDAVRAALRLGRLRNQARNGSGFPRSDRRPNQQMC